MAISRYTFSRRSQNGNIISKSDASWKLYQASQSGALQTTVKVLEEGERLDQLAGLYYGDSTLWWVIAGASGIGWALQAPAGTRLLIPANIGDVFSVLS